MMAKTANLKYEKTEQTSNMYIANIDPCTIKINGGRNTRSVSLDRLVKILLFQNYL